MMGFEQDASVPCSISGGQARLIPSSVQQLAVEESRLGVPLLLGLDVIHGHRTIYPVPLAEACALEPDLWEKTARAAAEEATRPCHTNRGAGPFDGYGSG